MKKHEDQSTTTTTVISDDRGPTAEEERILRMRAGASLPGHAPLENKLDAVSEAHRHEVMLRLRLIEDEARRAVGGQHLERKAHIIAALRSKSEE